MLLDGEVVSMRDGIPSFAAMAERFHVTDARRAAMLAEAAPVTLMTFDLLRLYGVELLSRPSTDRRATLERLELAGPRWQTPPTFADGPTLHAATKEQGLEGIVSKRVDSVYVPGLRSPLWLKPPHRGTVSVVIGGWRSAVHRHDVTTLGIGARRCARPRGPPLPGTVGSGLAGKTGAGLTCATSRSPDGQDRLSRTDVPAEDSAGATWVHPVLVADVQSLGLSGQGKLRQPAYKGLRSDLTPGDVDDHGR